MTKAILVLYRYHQRVEQKYETLDDALGAAWAAYDSGDAAVHAIISHDRRIEGNALSDAAYEWYAKQAVSETEAAWRRSWAG
jgi:hypothetical protein